MLAAQEAGFAELRPGADFKAFHRASARVLAEGLADLGVLPVSAAESLQPDSRPAPAVDAVRARVT